MESALAYLLCSAVLLGLIIGAAMLQKRQVDNQLLQSGIAEIDRMPGTTFERYLVAIFSQQGFDVEHTGRPGDYGADLVITRRGERTVVQAKRWRRQVGVRAVQEAVAARGLYRCSRAMVVTNSYFTRQAHILARANGVELWDRDLLLHMLHMSTPAAPVAGPAVRSSPYTDATTFVVKPIAAAPLLAASCADCGIQVSEKVRQFCVNNSARFSGKIFCYDHQRRRLPPQHPSH